MLKKSLKFKIPQENDVKKKLQIVVISSFPHSVENNVENLNSRF